MKKILILFTFIFCFGLFNFTVSRAASLPVYDETYNYNKGAFYANGTPITISEVDGKTVVSWEGGSQIVPNTVTIFGGGNGGTLESSSITMNGGTIQNLVGGGIGFNEENSSFVSNVKIIINDGNITNATVGGGYFFSQVDTSYIETNGGTFYTLQGGSMEYGTIGGISYSAGTKDDVLHSKSRVNTANIIINDGTTIKYLVFGGGQGYSYTGTANLTVNGGDLSKAYITAGGSNGYTGNSNVKINGGSIYLYQSVNRGTVENVNVKLNSGSINRFYVGGETEDSTVTGTANTITTHLVGGNIGTLKAGTSNSSIISIDNNKYKVISTNDVNISDDTISSSEIKIDYDFEVLPSNLTLFINKSQNLDLIIKTVPENYENIFNDTISYTSQNSEIATVTDTGVVTGLAKGNTVIEVKVGNKIKNVSVEVRDLRLLIIAGIAILILYVFILFLIFGVYVPIL